MTHHEKLIAALDAYKEENAKFQDKGVKASAARARKALQEITSSCKERRKEITAEKEMLEGKKGEGMSQDAIRHAQVRKKRSIVKNSCVVVWANLARTTKYRLHVYGLRYLALLGLINLFSAHAIAADDYMRGLSKDRISVQSLLPLMPSKTIIGQDYAYPTAGPLIESYLIEIPPGQKTAMHLHQVPLLAYVLSGKLETNYGSKGTKVSVAGDLFVEAIEWCHFGQTLGSKPVRILAIYLHSVGSAQKKSVDCSAMQ